MLDMEKFICKYCGRECKNKNALVQHEIRCKLNPEKLDLSYIKPGHSKGHKGGNQFTKALELSLPKPIISEETKRKIGIKSLNRKHTEETKLKISKSIKKAILEHPESYSASNVNGRVKHYIYNGYKIDGKWELLVAKYLDSLNIKWIKPNNSFEYIWDNTKHFYFPDFYLPDYNYYIEVKGYERERDLCKYQVVPNLIIIKKKEIEMIKKGNYILNI